MPNPRKVEHGGPKANCAPLSRLQNSRFRTFSEGAKRRKRDPRV